MFEVQAEWRDNAIKAKPLYDLLSVPSTTLSKEQPKKKKKLPKAILAPGPPLRPYTTDQTSRHGVNEPNRLYGATQSFGPC